MAQQFRWGLAAAGKIVHDFCTAISTLPPEEHKIAVVAAREKARAEEFAQKHGIPCSLGSYLELAKYTDIDIVYVGVLNPQHFEVSMLMLEHGKNVLCEKPLCLNQKQAKKLIETAQSKNLFLMEGVWSRFFPAYQCVRKRIDECALGQLQSVDVVFGTLLTQVERLQKKELGGGVVLDIGVYAIQFCQFVFKEPPQKIVAKGELNEEGMDIEVHCDLQYSGGRTAHIHLNGKAEMDIRAIIKGSTGQITLPQFWCCTKMIDFDGQEKEWPLPKGKWPTNFKKSEGLGYEAASVRRSVLAGEKQNQNIPHRESLIIASIQDEIRKQLGVVFPADQA